MKRKLGIGIMFAALLMALLPATVFAGTLQLTVYEDASYQHDNWTLEGGEKSLANDGNGLSSNGCDCGSVICFGWDNCISSFHLYLGAGRCLAMYDGNNYSGTRLYYYRNPYGYDVGYNVADMGSKNDRVSSIRFGVVSGSGCQWSAGG